MVILKGETIAGIELFFEKTDFGNGIEVAMWQHKPNSGANLIGYFDSKDEAIQWFRKYGEQPTRR